MRKPQLSVEPAQGGRRRSPLAVIDPLVYHALIQQDPSLRAMAGTIFARSPTHREQGLVICFRRTSIRQNYATRLTSHRMSTPAGSGLTLKVLLRQGFNNGSHNSQLLRSLPACHFHVTVFCRLSCHHLHVGCWSRVSVVSLAGNSAGLDLLDVPTRSAPVALVVLDLGSALVHLLQRPSIAIWLTKIPLAWRQHRICARASPSG